MLKNIWMRHCLSTDWEAGFFIIIIIIIIIIILFKKKHHNTKDLDKNIRIQTFESNTP